MAESLPPKAWSEFCRNYPRWIRPFLPFEWLTEWAVYWLKRWAFIELTQLLAALSIVWVAFSYVLATGERRQAAADQRKLKHYQAWQIVNSARRGDGGRVEALQDLVKDGLPLSRLDLSSAMLEKVQLPKADLSESNLSSAFLRGANLQEAVFSGANLAGADLAQANLQAAILSNASLPKAILAEADLSGATLLGSDLRGAVLSDSFRNISQLDDANIYGGSRTPRSVQVGAPRDECSVYQIRRGVEGIPARIKPANSKPGEGHSRAVRPWGTRP